MLQVTNDKQGKTFLQQKHIDVKDVYTRQENIDSPNPITHIIVEILNGMTAKQIKQFEKATSTELEKITLRLELYPHEYSFIEMSFIRV
jgi:hypothetical protein